MFTWWSVRTNARPVNKGIRLDYFICSNDLFSSQILQSKSSFPIFGEEEETKLTKKRKSIDTVTVVTEEPAIRVLQALEYKDEPIPCVYDSYILHQDTFGISDHCPVVLVIKLV